MGIVPSTVHRVLRSARLNMLSYVDRATGELIRRYEHDHPGSLVHVDVKKLGNIPDGGGWRYVGRRQGEKNHSATPDKPRGEGRNPKLGYVFVHTFLDDHSYPDPMDFLAIPTLRGALASLEPLAPEHAEELAEAVAEDDLYKVWHTRLPSPDRMSAEIEKRLSGHAAGQVVPWTIRDAERRAVGMTTLLNIRPDHRRLEIGSTWIAPSAQGTGLNTQVKLLQLTHAFESLDCIAVKFRTHWHNHRSRAAVAALEAKQDGVLRNHDLWRDGTMRDVVVFSIIDSEWPSVRLSLTEKMRTRTRASMASTTA